MLRRSTVRLAAHSAELLPTRHRRRSVSDRLTFTVDPTPTFEFSSSESNSTFKCRVDSNLESGFQPCSSPYTLTARSDGPHTFEVRATDQAGNTDASPATRKFTVDTAAPQTTIGSGPPAATNDSTPTFEFSSSEPSSTFKCRVDSNLESDFQPCSSPYTLTARSDGPHTFEVRATDQAGNTDQSPASRSFAVDTALPQTTIVSGPPASTNDSTPTFEFSSSEANSTFKCRVDSNLESGFQPCSSPSHAHRQVRRATHLRGARHRPGRQHRRKPGEPLIHGGHRGAADDDLVRPLRLDGRLDTDL